MDRLASDHPSVHTVDATLVRAGRTDRPRVAIPGGAADRFPADEVVRLVVDGDELFSPVAAELTGDGLELRGAFETPEAAREPGDGTDHLPDWREAAGVPFGNTVHVDVVEDGYKYGLRAPGERAVYTTGRPDEGLQDIADDLLGDG
ncbi:hypothetical protein BRC81_16295 [Halobacteriales archaeon QS_1_68_20]|nr:MAG: hypothetical protein BRC81_16295 [Halobacteriales archaeon QS_1_68_20]